MTLRTGWPIALVLYAVALVVILVAFDRYALLLDETNHTGTPVHLLTWMYAASAVAAAVLLRRARERRAARWALWVVLLVAMAGTLNLVALDQLNVMSEYETWVYRGMPSKPSWVQALTR